MRIRNIVIRLPFLGWVNRGHPVAHSQTRRPRNPLFDHSRPEFQLPSPKGTYSVRFRMKLGRLNGVNKRFTAEYTDFNRYKLDIQWVP